MSENFKYRLKDELLIYIGKEIEYYGFDSKILKGVLEQDTKGLWLPFSGGVNTLTVKIKI